MQKHSPKKINQVSFYLFILAHYVAALMSLKRKKAFEEQLNKIGNTNLFNSI